LFTDISNQNIGTALQERGDNGWKPLAFFSKKLSPAEAKYSALDRELLVIYLAIKHFQHMFEARTFVIYIDHKPLIRISTKIREEFTSIVSSLGFHKLIHDRYSTRVG